MRTACKENVATGLGPYDTGRDADGHRHRFRHSLRVGHYGLK